MSDSILSSVVGILTAIVGLAIIAVILSQHSDTSNVISSGGNAFSQILGQAVNPVSA
jgi:hypothetical protein